MNVSDNTIQAEVLADLFENLGGKGLNVSKKRETFCPTQQELWILQQTLLQQQLLEILKMLQKHYLN